MKRIFLLLTLAIILTTSSIVTALSSMYQADGHEDHPGALSGGEPEV